MKTAALFLLAIAAFAQRPPAVPLIAHDPYFSIWSAANELPRANTTHWTGKPHELRALLRVDGKVFRLMGQSPLRRPEDEITEPARQLSLTVTPTRTIYQFEANGVRARLSFLTPTLPHNLDVLSRPATYIDFQIEPDPARAHSVQLYFEATASLAVDNPTQRVQWARHQLDNGQVLKLGSVDQPVLARKGDDLRIDWGFLYLTAPASQSPTYFAGPNIDAWRQFILKGSLPSTDDFEVHNIVRFQQPALTAAFDLGQLSTPQNRWLVLAYDDVFSIEYFFRKLRPYWRRKGDGPAEMLRAALAEKPALQSQMEAFDAELNRDLEAQGGKDFAYIATLAYRQAIAAHKLAADADGTPLFFSKENFSNGCIATMDVTYPSAPQFLLLNPTLLKAMLQPVLEYAAMGRWPWPYAPHDLGTYPQANGQVYGGGEKSEDRQMPVEESGNVLILTAALARAEGNAKLAERYWTLLDRWADYLKNKGLDPDNQLSTDDFAGHLAHNANLSIKAILGLAAFADLAQQLNKPALASQYRNLASKYAKQWQAMAADGDHYKLAFDKPGSWSQKYNLVWDSILGYNLFDPAIAQTEVAFYKKVQGPFGLPLDNRSTYTKLDWILWSATLANKRADFESLVAPVAKFLNETPDRVPMTDWYFTDTAKQRGFQARSVVGGVYIPMLTNKALWQKWASRANKAN